MLGGASRSAAPPIRCLELFADAVEGETPRPAAARDKIGRAAAAPSAVAVEAIVRTKAHADDVRSPAARASSSSRSRAGKDAVRVVERVTGGRSSARAKRVAKKARGGVPRLPTPTLARIAAVGRAASRRSGGARLPTPRPCARRGGQGRARRGGAAARGCRRQGLARRAPRPRETLEARRRAATADAKAKRVAAVRAARDAAAPVRVAVADAGRRRRRRRASFTVRASPRPRAASRGAAADEAADAARAEPAPRGDAATPPKKRRAGRLRVERVRATPFSHIDHGRLRDPRPRLRVF